MALNQKRRDYMMQRYCAKQRGIDWQFTYESWCDWWGEDYKDRGKGKGKLQMGRFNDAGPYNPENCYKVTHENNLKDFYAKGEKKSSWYENVLENAKVRSKPIKTPLGIFQSVAEASKAHGITSEGLSYRIRVKKDGYEWL